MTDGNFQQAKTHCPHGHEYTPGNTKLIKSTKPGHFKRQCRTCKAIVSKRLAKERREREAAANPAKFEPALVVEVAPPVTANPTQAVSLERLAAIRIAHRRFTAGNAP
jgi:hypothetical protein